VPVFEPVNVPNVLNEVLEELRIAAKKKGVHLTSEIQGAMPVIYCDHQRLLRAVVNLGMNSVDAVPPDVGAVTLKAYVCRAEDADEAATVVPLPGALAQEEAVVIEVSDTGTGIPPDVRGHIFEPFFSTKASRGTGLGLPTVKQFVEDHHGGLFLHSSPEFGTKFQLVFSGAPLAAAEVTENATT
jgi:signal transduction histidine kinase